MLLEVMTDPRPTSWRDIRQGKDGSELQTCHTPIIGQLTNCQWNGKLIYFLRFCAVADEQNDRIYMIGGATSSRRQAVRYYRVSTNSWHSPTDSTTYWSVYVRNSSPKMFAADVIVIVSFTCHIRIALLSLLVGLAQTIGGS